MKGNSSLLGCLFEVAVVALLVMFIRSAIIGSSSRATPAGVPMSNYQPAEGDCFVSPQGDPLYDEHYAKNVNTPNCKAFKNQSDAKNTDANTRQTDWQTTKDKMFSYAFFGVLGVIVAFLLYSIAHGGS